MAGSKDGVQAAEKGQWLTVAERVSGHSWRVGARERGAAWPKVTVSSQGCREKRMHRKSRGNSGNRAFDRGIKPQHQNGMVAQPVAGAGGCGDPRADCVCLRPEGRPWGGRPRATTDSPLGSRLIPFSTVNASALKSRDFFKMLKLERLLNWNTKSSLYEPLIYLASYK